MRHPPGAPHPPRSAAAARAPTAAPTTPAGRIARMSEPAPDAHLPRAARRGLVLDAARRRRAEPHARSTRAAGSWQRSRLMMAQLAAAVPPRRAGACGCCATGHAAGTTATPSHPSPVPDARWALDQVRPSTAAARSCSSATRWAARTAAAVADDASSAASSRSPPGSRRASRSTPLRGKRLVRRPRAPRPDHRLRRHRGVRPPRRRRRSLRASSSTWATSATTCSAGSRGAGTGRVDASARCARPATGDA